MSLSTEITRHELPLEIPFEIARGETVSTTVHVVTVSDGEHTGIGGTGPSPHYGESPTTIEAVLPELCSIVEEIDDPHNLQAIEQRLQTQIRGHPAAKTAISMALHDLVCKRLGVPLYEYWGLDPAESIATSYTVGIDDPETMATRAKAAVDRGHGILKVKLGTDQDRAIIESIREAVPDVIIRVDANEAWDRTKAIRMAEFLETHDIEFLEQPVPAEYPNDLQAVYESSPIPIAADESCIRLPDIPAIADKSDIANIKLMKCAGLREAKRMIHAARAHGLDVMLGCMSESNASIGPACHLAPLLDYADLDGSLLLADDPYDGVPIVEGDINLKAVSEPGTGVSSN